MKYRMMKFEWLPDPSRQPAVIYIIPVSADSEEYRVIYPSTFSRNAVRLLYYGDVSIRAYKGCPPEALESVRQKLTEMLIQRTEGVVSRATHMFLGGIGLAVLGVISWTLPDPLPLVDEIGFLLGGVVLALQGARHRQKKVPAYREMARVAETQIDGLEPDDDPFLSAVVHSIQAKARPDGDHGEEDRIEAEGKWLVEYVNVREMIENETVKPQEVRRIVSGLLDVIPMRAMQVGRSSKRKRRRLERILARTGLSDDALTVYCEFYRAAREYFDSKGQKL